MLIWLLYFSLPSACAKRLEVLKLYDSIKTGVSQCHNTGNEKESSGTTKFVFRFLNLKLLGYNNIEIEILKY